MGIMAPYTPAATRSIVNGYSSGGVISGAMSFGSNAAKTTASGALTANTLATVVTVTGQGYASMIAAVVDDTTSRTVRLVVIVDGVTAFDATSSTTTTANTGLVAVGSITTVNGSPVLLDGPPIRFNASLVIRVASSLTETDNLTVWHKVVTE